MNWYKTSQVRTFTDRNHLNHRISDIKEMVMTLNYLMKYVYQNAPHAKAIMESFRDSKFISSYPNIKALMNSASQVALDNYGKFSIICDDIILRLMKEIKNMEDEREEFSTKYAPKVIKEKLKNE